MFHTVYNSFESKPNGRDYIGKHGTDDPYDNYLGSFKDKTFNPDGKIVIAYATTPEGAIWLEMMFQKVFNVVEDPQFVNRSYQTSTGFYFNRAGILHTEEAKQKMSKTRGGEKNPMFGKTGDKHPNFGKKLADETKQLISDSLAGEKNPMFGKTGEKNHMFGKKLTDNTKQKMSDVKIGEKNPCFGKKWWVNSLSEVLYQTENPGKGWQRGRKWEG
jgi:hypothetical protein